MMRDLAHTKYATIDDLASALRANGVPLDDEHECRMALMHLGYGVVRPDRLDRIRLVAGMMDCEERRAWYGSVVAFAAMGLAGPAQAIELDAPLLTPTQGAIGLAVLLVIAVMLGLWLAPMRGDRSGKPDGGME